MSKATSYSESAGIEGILSKITALGRMLLWRWRAGRRCLRQLFQKAYRIAIHPLTAENADDFLPIASQLLPPLPRRRPDPVAGVLVFGIEPAILAAEENDLECEEVDTVKIGD